MKKANRREQWMLWAMPIVALSPLWLGRAISRWPEEWRWSYKMENARRNSCQSQLRQLAVAFQMYREDYDERHPPVSTRGSATSWSDCLAPYFGLRSPPPPGIVHFFTCPSLPQLELRTTNLMAQAHFRDYWFNARLSKVCASTLSAPAATFLVGEGNDGHDINNATYSKIALPPTWLANTNSPLFRHLNGANFLFADGHVKWLRPNEALHFNRRSDPFAP